MSVDVDMSLHERHGLSEDIIAGTNEVHIEYRVVPYNTKHSFVVVSGRLRSESDYNSCL